MTDAERIEQLEGEVRAAVYAGADTISAILRAMCQTAEDCAEMAEKLRKMSGAATEQSQLRRADILRIAAEMMEQK
ncbi:hypothetical protein [Falsirhodobacter sp. 1013]|uniref:hypothetical protein n=1 Tax=Falsirhodobacter sp. 1013 TaxID=3417566 RepID=UPI003EB7E1D0